MADNIYNNSNGDNDGNVDANWSLGNVPAGTDVAVFDSSTTSANCTFSGALNCAGMRFDGAYAGIVDAATFAITLGTSGLDCTGGGSATLDLGSGTWTCSGNWDHNSIGTLTAGTATVILDGTSVTFRGHTSKGAIALLQIDGTVSLSTTTNSRVVSLTASNGGTFTIPTGRNLEIEGGTCTLEATGTITSIGTGYLNIDDGDIVNNGGTWTCDTSLVGGANCDISSGTYGGTWDLISGSNRTARLGYPGGGTVTFTGAVTFDSFATGGQTLVIDCSQGDPDIVFQGPVTWDESGGNANLTWTKGGTGTTRRWLY